MKSLSIFAVLVALSYAHAHTLSGIISRVSEGDPDGLNSISQRAAEDWTILAGYFCGFDTEDSPYDLSMNSTTSNYTAPTYRRKLLERARYDFVLAAQSTDGSTSNCWVAAVNNWDSLGACDIVYGRWGNPSQCKGGGDGHCASYQGQCFWIKNKQDGWCYWVCRGSTQVYGNNGEEYGTCSTKYSNLRCGNGYANAFLACTTYH